MGKVSIYTDGSAKGNPGNGGYGAILLAGHHKKELSEGFVNTTNNRMELLAVIEALKKLKKSGLKISVYTDSKYVVDSVEKKWVFNWQKKGFKNKKNIDLWLEFLKVYEQNSISFKWIKGHNNHPQNEVCDKLAFNASENKPLLVDTGYENNLNKLF